MNSRKIQDRIHLALGRAANHVGILADAYRTAEAHDPLDPKNRYLRLPAHFLPASGSESRVGGVSELVWHGIFDGSYTRPGDYIIAGPDRFFIAKQDRFEPIICIRTTRTITISRPNAQTLPASNPYGGYTPATSTVLLSNYPAGVTGETRSTQSSLGLPTGETVPYWFVQLPAPPGVAILSGDVIADDLNRTAVVMASDLNPAGWRINAKMAT
jgi:hypothetical protein